MEIKRDIYLNKLISKQHNGLVKVVTGVRRCGKSYLLFNLFRDYLAGEHIADDHIIEMAFDSYENKKYRDPEVFFPYLKERINDKDMYDKLVRRRMRKDPRRSKDDPGVFCWEDIKMHRKALKQSAKSSLTLKMGRKFQ